MNRLLLCIPFFMAFLRYTVFVLQSPAYLPVYLAPEAVRKSTRRIFDHSFPRQPSACSFTAAP